MSEPLKSEPLPLPFFIADAWLERISDVVNDVRLSRAYVGVKRHQLSAGSSRVDILYRQKKAGWIGLIAMSEHLTLFEAYATDQQIARTLLAGLTEQFWHTLLLVAKSAIELDVRGVPMLAELRDMVRAVTEVLPQEPDEPKRGDPINAWLDWRDAEKQRTGRRIPLRRIADMGDFKLDTLKKKSAERHRQADESTDDNAPDAP